jgi:nuclear pore complex protein Nup155
MQFLYYVSAISWLVPNFLTGFAEEDPLVQIVVDSTRNILYTRSEKGTLGLYDLGPNGEAMEKITSMTSQVWLGSYVGVVCGTLGGERATSASSTSDPKAKP